MPGNEIGLGREGDQAMHGCWDELVECGGLRDGFRVNGIDTGIDS